MILERKWVMTRIRADFARTALVAGVMTLGLTATGAGRADAQAARVCMPQAEILVERLGEEYGETLTAAGVDANGNLVQVYSSPTTGSWTIAVTVPGGPTCIVTSGEGWAAELTAQMPKPGVNS